MQDQSIKRAVFAGSWYPGDPRECEVSIHKFLAAGSQDKDNGLSGTVVGGIVPHAGWGYSGGIACRVIAALRPGNEADKSSAPIDTILLFGAHMHPETAPFTLARGAVETPFGEIRVDRELAELTVSYLEKFGLPIQSLSAEAFPDENTLELQYPFIRYFFPDARIAVFGVPPSTAAAGVGEAAVDAALALGRSVRIIGSTDMTHYGPDFRFAPEGTGAPAVDWVRQENDRSAIRAMEEMDAPGLVRQGLSHKNMCCPGAAAAAVAACKKMGAAKGFCLDYATSYEKTRSSSFVGYCGLVYTIS